MEHVDEHLRAAARMGASPFPSVRPRVANLHTGCGPHSRDRGCRDRAHCTTSQPRLKQVSRYIPEHWRTMGCCSSTSSSGKKRVRVRRSSSLHRTRQPLALRMIQAMLRILLRGPRSGPSGEISDCTSAHRSLSSLLDACFLGALRFSGGGGNRTPVPGRPFRASPGAAGGEISPRGSHRRRTSWPARVRCPAAAPGRSRCREPAHDAHPPVAGDREGTAT